MYTVLVIFASFLTRIHAIKYPDFNNKNYPIVSAPIGRIQGSIIISRLGKTIFSFRGIRYAKPPVGEYRFQATVPIEQYGGVYNATVDAPLCPQPTRDPTSEDCLFLNVYSTKLPDKRHLVKRPVIVHISPGGLYIDSGVSYYAGPQYFLDQDIVLVTFNYRLATLGFLATGTKEAVGNFGFKDQVQALKWVKQNIESFGGDPNSVTILGQSAGALSVTLHMISPMSTGLFHKAVFMSGSAIAQFKTKHDQLELAQIQARLLNCPDESPELIVNCLKTKDAQEIADTLLRFRDFGPDPEVLWGPVIEKDYGQPRFLTDQPIKLITEGRFHKVPLIGGVTTDEFAYKSIYIYDNKTLLKRLNNHWDETAPISFLYEEHKKSSKIISKKLRKFYFHDKPVDKSNLKYLGQLYADSIVGFGTNRAVKLFSEYNTQPTYYYKFSYQGRYSHYYYPNTTKPYGVVHQDDLIYLFYNSESFPKFNATSPQREVEMVAKLTRLYANFAKYGNPTPKATDLFDHVIWKPFNNYTMKYLDINQPLVMRKRLYENRYEEWQKLFPLEEYLNR